MRLAEHVAFRGEKRKTQGFKRDPEGKRPLGTSRHG
jgi:hypothetical protein